MPSHFNLSGAIFPPVKKTFLHVWRKSKNLGSMMMGFDLAQLRKVIFGLFLVFYTEKQTFGVRQTDRWLSRRFIFLCQTWPTFIQTHTHTSWYIMSPWKNSYGVKEGSFSRCGFYATKRLIKDNIQKVLPLCLWSDWSRTPSYRACGESWFSRLVVLSHPKTECSCRNNGKWCDQECSQSVTEICCSFIMACLRTLCYYIPIELF